MSFFKIRKLGTVYNDKEVVFAEGDQAHRIIIIQEGHVELSIQGIQKAVLGKDDILGISCLFEPGVRGATATAVGEARVISVDRKIIIKQMHTDPSLMIRMLKMTVRRLRQCETYCRNNTISGKGQKNV
jgi:CRP/FNR family transcriptional regulator, cyclic AMP receptor protein